MMIDSDPNWINQRWSVDTVYTRRENVPILATLIEKHGFVFDDIYRYEFHGRAKQFVYRFPHYGGQRSNFRLPTEGYRVPLPKGQQTLRGLCNMTYCECWHPQSVKCVDGKVCCWICGKEIKRYR